MHLFHRLNFGPPAALLLCTTVGVAGCDKSTEPSAAPEDASAAAAPREAPAAEAAAPEQADADKDETGTATGPLVGEDAIAIGVLNTEWGHDHMGKRRPKQSQQNSAKSAKDWEWKTEQLANLLAKYPLDVIVLTEIAGERELGDLQLALRERTGNTYDYAILPTEDRFFGHNVGILSKFDVADQSRLDAKVPTQLVADLELPSGDTLTVAAFMFRSGDNDTNLDKRIKQAKSFKRRVNILARKGPVLAIGTSESNDRPSDSAEYRQSAAGIMAGANTRDEDSDDCSDSGKWADETTVSGELRDHIFACGLEMRQAKAVGRDMLIRGEVDPDEPWSTLPIDEAPMRDASDHLLVWAEVVLPDGGSE